jgi:hypothetical protein
MAPRATGNKTPSPRTSEIAILAGASFIEFVESIHKNDLLRAGEAQRKLKRFGFEVALRPHKLRRAEGVSA